MNLLFCPFCRKVQRDTKELIPAFIKGAIVQSSLILFGQVGGQSNIDLLRFDETKQTGIVRVPLKLALKTRAAITSVSSFQGTSAVFKVDKSSELLSSLVESFVEF